MKRLLTLSAMIFAAAMTAAAQEADTYPDTLWINEAVVTAKEEKGVTATSKIGKDAISHIQPSSIADLLELLPGGLSRDPVLSSPQSINLRAAGNLSSDYITSALGTRFTIDGRPVLNDANLQYTPAFSSLGTDYVNLGTDMRTISTEEIESVDVVRGIASVRHGDLTSGLVQIRRIKGGQAFRMRAKADMQSKLIFAGKGWEWGDKDKTTLNIGVNFLNSQADPRNPRQNYKRLTGSVRAGHSWMGGENYTHALNLSLDYTGSFDNRKSDRNIDEIDGLPVETYKSSDNRIELGADYTIRTRDEEAFFHSFALTGSLSYEQDLIDRWKQVIMGADEPMSVSREAGEFDAIMIPARYEATLQVDGKPFYAYLQAISDFRFGSQKLMLGAEWTFDKNFGEGSIFDIYHPFSTSMSARPRAYKDIPADNQLAFFAEENGSLEAGRWKLEWSAGARLSALLGLPEGYSLRGKPYIDPRANIRVNFPETAPGGYRLEAGLWAGAGLHTKFPTMDMLYPEPIYGDRQQLNYWPTDKSQRRINYLVYIIDPTNKALEPARNLKWETGIDASWKGWSFSADFFVEDMRSGFRTGTEYIQLISKDYDESAIDRSTLVGPPSTEGLPYQLDTTLIGYGLTTNGSRTRKTGVEYTLTSERIPYINTRVNVSGAWFLTNYMNSQPEYERPSSVIDGKPYPYIGIYEKNDSFLHETFNTSILLDTQVPSLGLIFTTSFQCTWFTGQQRLSDDSVPVAYLDKELVRHPFTEESDADGVLHQMVRQFSGALLEYRRVPFYMNVNLKLTKKLYRDKLRASLFVNRLFTVAPDYEVDGVVKRRSSTPYFGMEISFAI